MFDPFASVRFIKTFYTSLRPRRQTLLKAYHQYVSRKNFQITHRGRRYREAFYDNFVPDNVVRAAAWHAPHVNITVNRLPAPPACHWWK